MKRLLLALASVLALSAPAAHAQAPHIYMQPELDALVAPIALYPDALITQVLMAARFPDQVAAASRLPRDAQPEESWDPNVKALLAFPEILTRMGESPQWTRDLGLAFANQEPHVMDTVQTLRKRAQSTGQLQSNDQTTVTQQDQAIVVQPRNPEVVYVPYYDPYVVYGAWWWPAYRPVIWTPWVVRPVFVTAGFFWARPNWATRRVVVVNRTVNVQRNVVVRPNVQVQRNVVVRDYQRVPESQRQPIVRSGPQSRTAMPAATRYSESRAPQQQARMPQHQPRVAANTAPRNGGEMRGGAQRGGGEMRGGGEARGGGWGGGHGAGGQRGGRPG
jgi:hypothetical protein